ncbi:MAG: HRDC domain-containing protein, partial [Gemmatimonadales bacterium]
DKPNVRLVVHWAPPATPEAYYQEAGRAGRDGGFARCVLLWRPGDAALHRRQLDVTFPPKPELEEIWSKVGRVSGVPENVLQSAERLRRELRPERGPVDWRPVSDRRRKAEARIQAVAEYAHESRCRRARLVGYFGERLARCSGCDCCGTKARFAPENRDVSARLSRLRAALVQSKTPWGGCPLEPEVLLALARNPPPTAAALADVPGVGPALAASLGGAILGALAGNSVKPSPSHHPLISVLQQWRAGVARDMGVPAYTVLPDSALSRIATQRPCTRLELAKVQGVGPRALAKFGDTLLEITGLASTPTA